MVDVDSRLFCVGPVNQSRHANALNQLCADACAELCKQLIPACLVAASRFDLYKLVMGNGAVALGNQAFTQTFVTNQNNRIQCMTQST